MCKVFGLPLSSAPRLTSAQASTSGTATEDAIRILHHYRLPEGALYPIADFQITPDVAIVDPELTYGMPVAFITSHWYGRTGPRHRGIRSYRCFHTPTATPPRNHADCRGCQSPKGTAGTSACMMQCALLVLHSPLAF